MTNEEAKRILISDAGFSGVREKAKVTADALYLAVYALQKRTPKKPKALTSVYPKGQYECPACEACCVGRRDTYQTPFGEMQSNRMITYDFCPNCGQAIDWSDIDEYGT